MEKEIVAPYLFKSDLNLMTKKYSTFKNSTIKSKMFISVLNS